MSKRVRLFLLLMTNGLFLLLDRLLKELSLGYFTVPDLIHPLFGWMPSLNPGIAFSLPMPSNATVFLTVPILLIIIGFFLKLWYEPEQPQWNLRTLSLSLIFFGASSNLYDRIIYKHTVDYFLILTAIINLADVMITAGFILFLLSYRKQKANT